MKKVKGEKEETRIELLSNLRQARVITSAIRDMMVDLSLALDHIASALEVDEAKDTGEDDDED